MSTNRGRDVSQRSHYADPMEGTGQITSFTFELVAQTYAFLQRDLPY